MKPFRSKKGLDLIDQNRQAIILGDGGTSLTLETPDQKKIDATLFRGKKKQAIIFCPGSGLPYELCNQEMLTLKARLGGNPSVLCFNPRGVGRSTGTPTEQGVTLDVLTAFKFFVEKEGIDPSDVVIYGYSLGGGYGAKAASAAQIEYPEAKISFISDRSFYKMTAKVSEVLEDAFPTSHWIHKLALKILSWLGWELDALSAVKTLKGKKCILYNRADKNIPSSLSLYRYVKNEGALPETVCIHLMPHLENLCPHTRDLRPCEVDALVNELHKIWGEPQEPILNSTLVETLGQPSRDPEVLEVETLSRLLLASRRFPTEKGEAIHHLMRLESHIDSLRLTSSYRAFIRKRHPELAEKRDSGMIHLIKEGVAVIQAEVEAFLQGTLAAGIDLEKLHYHLYEACRDTHDTTDPEFGRHVWEGKIGVPPELIQKAIFSAR